MKKLQFGSKIDGEVKKREDLYSVKEVLSPEKILLNNGLTIRLLGVKSKNEFKLKAVRYLEEKFNKRKVFLKYDEIKYSQDNELMCYVYLENKTFVNNHLIRTGFVDVDISFDYSCKKKFLASLPV